MVDKSNNDAPQILHKQVISYTFGVKIQSLPLTCVRNFKNHSNCHIAFNKKINALFTSITNAQLFTKELTTFHILRNHKK